MKYTCAIKKEHRDFVQLGVVLGVIFGIGFGIVLGFFFSDTLVNAIHNNINSYAIEQLASIGFFTFTSAFLGGMCGCISGMFCCAFSKILTSIQDHCFNREREPLLKIINAPSLSDEENIIDLQQTKTIRFSQPVVINKKSRWNILSSCNLEEPNLPNKVNDIFTL